MKIIIEFYRTRDAEAAPAVVARETTQAADLDNAIEIARLLSRTLDMSQQPDAMTITDAHAVPVHEELERRSPESLGIHMPFPTVKPLVAAFMIVVMFSGLLFLRNASHAVGLTLLIGGAIATFTAFYSWLTAPLE